METRADIVKEYAGALLHIPQLLRRLAFKTRTLEQELLEAMLRGNLRKSFNGLGLLMLGLGVVIGTGVFTLTGQALAEYAGSAVFLSYLLTGIACACAAACYAELCVEYPVSGSAFTYVMTTFGELPAFLTLGMMGCEYVLGAAAVARGFSRYLALLTNNPPSVFVVPYGNGQNLDYMALAVVLVLSAALSFGTRESSAILTGATLLKLAMLLTIVIVGFTQASGSTFSSDFTLQPDPGVDGIFQGAAFVFFAYTAFDAVCNAAEEAQDIACLPGAIMGTVGVSGLIYMLMALSLSLMVTSSELMKCGVNSGGGGALVSDGPTVGPNEKCPDGLQRSYQLAFAAAFTAQGLPGMQYFVALTALLGTTTSMLVSLYSAARIVMVAARDWLLPPPLARISPRTQTPLLAQMTLGLVVALVALLVSFVKLSQLVSAGTLAAMWAVCNTLLVRRFYPGLKLRFTRFGTVEAEESKAVRGAAVAACGALPVRARRALVALHLLAVNALSIGFAAVYGATQPQLSTSEAPSKGHARPSGIASIATAAAWLLATASMALACPLEYEPKGWRIPRALLPLLPSLAILLICFSVASLDAAVFEYMAYYVAGLLAFYVVYALPMSYLKHFKLDAQTAEQLNVVELVYHEGRWTKVMDLASVQRLPSGMTAEISGLSSVLGTRWGAPQAGQGGSELSGPRSSGSSDPTPTPGADGESVKPGPPMPVPSGASVTQLPAAVRLPALPEEDLEESGGPRP